MATNALWVLYLYFVAGGAVSKHDVETWPRVRNARIKMQRRASNLQSQNAFDAGALHPSRRTSIPAPAATPDVRRDGIDIRRNNMLAAGEHDSFFQPTISDKTATLRK